MHILPNFSYKFLILCFFSFFSLNLFAQAELDYYQQELGIKEALYPPEDMLSASSLVLFSVPKEMEPNEWKIRLTALQAFFADQGIDAVAYVNIASIYNRPGVAQGVPDILRTRQIKNLILFHDQGEEKPIFLAMGPLSSLQSYWTEGDLFWMRKAENLDPVFSELDIYFRTGARKRTNLLVNDEPEFFQAQPENERILLTAKPSIRPAYKVALRNWDEGFYRQLGAHKFLDSYLKSPSSYDRIWKRRHLLFSELANDTTNIIDFVELGVADQELQRNKFDYELSVLFGNHQQLSSFFKTEEPMPPFEGERAVFYMKSLLTNTIYLPKNWSPKADWSQALNQILEAFKSMLYPTLSD